MANERIQQTRITHVVPEKKIQIQGADSKVTKIVQVVMPKKGLIEKRKTPIIIPNTKIHKLNKFHMTKNPNSIPEAEKAPIISNVISNATKIHNNSEAENSNLGAPEPKKAKIVQQTINNQKVVQVIMPQKMSLGSIPEINLTKEGKAYFTGFTKDISMAESAGEELLLKKAIYKRECSLYDNIEYFMLCFSICS